jgi:Leucine-rich repeat (LRR) protein
MHTKPCLLLTIVCCLMGVTVSAGAWPAPPKIPKSTKAPLDNSSNRLADHEARRAKFRALCANPTPSQRETLQIWAKGDGKTYGTEFCSDVEYKYFGTKDRPKTWDTVAFGGVDNIRDYSPIQYFGNVLHLGIGKAAADLSPVASYTELESFSIGDSKEVFDISVIANFKNLKTVSLQNVQVVSLAPLANLSKLETLNLSIDAHTGLPGREGLDALRRLKRLAQLDIRVAEPLGDQLKYLENLKGLAVYGAVKDVCSLAGLRKLNNLYLIKSGIRDISCLKGLKELVDVNLRGNPITSISELAPLPKLMNLSIEDTLIEDLSAFTGNPNAYIFETSGTPLRWCSPKNASDIKKGVSCFNADGTEKPWWKRLLRW